MNTTSSSASTGTICVSVIDVGKGDCILVQVGETAVLIDTGYAETSGKVLSYLRNQGVTHLESLVITHYDADHIGGVRDIGKELSIGMVYLPGYEGTDKNYRALVAALADTKLSAQQVSGQLKLAVGNASMRLFPSSVSYSPGKKGEEGNDNDMSLVAELHYGDDSYLFASDIEKDGIEAFLQANHGQFDVLKVPHHGNKSPLSDELFESVQPQIAIITDSADEPADKKTLKLLAQNGATAYCTSTSGTVVVQSDGAGHYTVA